LLFGQKKTERVGTFAWNLQYRFDVLFGEYENVSWNKGSQSWDYGADARNLGEWTVIPIEIPRRLRLHVAE
jgi:hypothetical protein